MAKLSFSAMPSQHGESGAEHPGVIQSGGVDRAGYRPSAGSRPLAAAMSALIVLGGAGVLTLLNMVSARHVRREPALVTLNLMRPAAAAPKARQQTSKAKALPSRPVPLVRIPVATETPVPPVAVTASPNPAPVTAPMTQVSAPAPTAVKSAPAPAAEPSIMNASDLSSSMISATPPVYPVESRRKHEQGTVVLKLLLGIDGRASSVDVTRSSGSARLDQAALAAVRKWRWKPVVRDGEPVLVQGIVTIPFVLRSS